MNIVRDYVDERGISHRVLLPNDHANSDEGIPLEVPIERLYTHMPIAFVAKLSAALFARGLVEPHDFFRPGAHELTRDALLDIVREDALSIIALARQMEE